MSKKVRIAPVTEDNWEDVVNLQLTADQRPNLPDNAVSLVEAHYAPQMSPRAIYAGKKVVGFLMYEQMLDEDAPQDYALLRLMIDKRRQAHGYGRTAVSLALKEMCADPKLKRVLTFYWPSNKVAQKFYASFGFKELELDEDGEMIAEWRPPGR